MFVFSTTVASSTLNAVTSFIGPQDGNEAAPNKHLEPKGTANVTPIARNLKPGNIGELNLEQSFIAPKNNKQACN